MRRMTIGITHTLISGLLVTGLLVLSSAWGQTQDPLQDVEKRLAEKRTAAEIHRKQMESINPTATFVLDIRAATPYAPPAYPAYHQEALYVTHLSDCRRRLCPAHI
jgi:hypothetical protein